MKLAPRTMAWLFVTFAVLGFLLAIQARVQESRNRDLQAQSIDELTTLVGTLSRENERLQTEVRQLERVLVDARYAGEDDASRMIEQRRNLTALKLATGSIAGFGPGMRVEIDDPDGELEAYDLGQLVNELKSAGAEALVLNGRRLDFRAAFRDDPSGIALGRQLLERPYVLEAVGNPVDLESSLVMAGGVAPTLQGRPGVTVQLEQRERVDAPGNRNQTVFVYAVRGRD